LFLQQLPEDHWWPTNSNNEFELIVGANILSNGCAEQCDTVRAGMIESLGVCVAGEDGALLSDDVVPLSAWTITLGSIKVIECLFSFDYFC